MGRALPRDLADSLGGCILRSRERPRRSDPPLLQHRLPRARAPAKRPARSLRRAPPGQGAPRRARGVAPARPSRRRHRRDRDGPPGGLVAPPASPRHSSQHHVVGARATRRRARPRHPSVLSRRVAPPGGRHFARLSRLPRGAAGGDRDCRAVRVPDSDRPRGGAALRRRGRRLRATPLARLCGRRAAVRHRGTGHARAAGLRARDHPCQGIRRLLPRGARHRQACPRPTAAAAPWPTRW